MKFSNALPSLSSIIIFCFLAPSILTGHARAEISKSSNQEEIRIHYLTDWQIEPSLKYDVLCFLNTLTADSFYLKHYKPEYEEFEKALKKPVKKALSNLKRKIKDEKRGIISTFFCLYFSAVEDKTIDDMLLTIENSESMRKSLIKTPYYSDAGWRLYESVGNDLKTVLIFLKEIQFEFYWKKYILPKINETIKQIRGELPKYNIIDEVEAHLGFKLPSRKITAYILYFSKPHGIKITGTRYLTNVAWPLEVVLRNAIHEMMHSPYDLASDIELKKVISLLKKDKFLMDKVLNHNPSYGYNSFEAFIEEDCVQALEQIINEKLDLEVEAHKRWQEADEGMHVFAVALYSVMKKKKFNRKAEKFRDFLIRMIQSGELAPGRIKAIYDNFYAKSS
ncbi:MAG: hypothetical protein GTO16_00215 [Candidatus Aminicenantes bacterium]|nr:hypothetical protein [Candidatus Aminicenantes bacterium]